MMALDLALDVPSLNLGHTLYVILGKVLNLPGSHFPHPSNGEAG